MAVIAPQKSAEKKQKHYPNYKIIVLNDDHNTFDHVHDCLVRYIPNMTSDKAWELTFTIHIAGLAIVWIGPLEQAELFHEQLTKAGLTMAPLEVE